MNDYIKNKIYEVLAEREANLHCFRCKNGQFEVQDEYHIQYSFKEFERTGYFPPHGGIPCIALICNKCGCIVHHSIGDLGLIPSVIEYPNTWNITHENT
jgi:hypothetical protein